MLREKQSPNYSKELLIIRKCISSVTKREEKNRSYSKRVFWQEYDIIIFNKKKTVIYFISMP